MSSICDIACETEFDIPFLPDIPGFPTTFDEFVGYPTFPENQSDDVDDAPSVHSRDQSPQLPCDQHFSGQDHSGNHAMQETQGPDESPDSKKLQATQPVTTPEEFSLAGYEDFRKLVRLDIAKIHPVPQCCRVDTSQAMSYDGHEAQAGRVLNGFDLAQEPIIAPISLEYGQTVPYNQRYYIPEPNGPIFQHNVYYTPSNSSISSSDIGEAQQSLPNSFSVANASYPYCGPSGVGLSTSYESSSSSDLQPQQFELTPRQQRYDNIQISSVQHCRRRESSEGKTYRECSSSPSKVADYWNKRHTSKDTPRPTPIKYKSPEQRAVARLEKKALDEARKAKKRAVREKELRKMNGEENGAVLVG